MRSERDRIAKKGMRGGNPRVRNAPKRLIMTSSYLTTREPKFRAYEGSKYGEIKGTSQRAMKRKRKSNGHHFLKPWLSKRLELLIGYRVDDWLFRGHNGND